MAFGRPLKLSTENEFLLTMIGRKLHPSDIENLEFILYNSFTGKFLLNYHSHDFAAVKMSIKDIVSPHNKTVLDVASLENV